MSSPNQIWFDDNFLFVQFLDGRILASPKTWFPKFMAASDEQLSNFEVTPFGVHWPDLDEDVSVDGLLNGRASSYGL